MNIHQIHTMNREVASESVTYWAMYSEVSSFLQTEQVKQKRCQCLSKAISD